MADARPVLLIVEDDPGLQKQMRWSFSSYETVLASDANEAVAQLRKHSAPVVTLDLGLPPHADTPETGLALISQLLEVAPDTKIIVLTGQHDRDIAIKAIGLGAHDFFAKPFEPELLKVIIDRAFRVHDLQQENMRLRSAGASTALAGFVTRDEATLKVCRMIERVSGANVSVMLNGESGTGKEVLARALHSLSSRSKQRFVAINCAAIPENLLESELFGYERGAFTGAVKQTKGRVEYADGGTLFLDEIGDLPMPLQAKLLRFLQERVIERVGGRDEISVDARVVCATHRDLRALIRDGRFREDLFFRLCEVAVEIPPIRKRPGDAVLLAHIVAARVAAEMKRRQPHFHASALAAMEAHGWPGNVREIENVIKRAVILCDGDTIMPDDLGLAAPTDESSLDLREARETLERSYVTRALALTDGNMVKAAELLGVSRPTLYDLVNKFSIRT